MELYNQKMNDIDASVLLFGGLIRVNLNDIKIMSDQIIFLASSSIPRINFAGGVIDFYDPNDYIISVHGKSVKLPPIWYHKYDDYTEFQIDMFRNGYVITTDVKVPEVLR